MLVVSTNLKGLKEESTSPLQDSKLLEGKHKQGKSTNGGQLLPETTEQESDKPLLQNTILQKEVQKPQAEVEKPETQGCPAVHAPQPPKSLKEYLQRFSGIQTRDPADIVSLIAADKVVDRKERAALKAILKASAQKDDINSVQARFLSFFGQEVEACFARSRSNFLGVRAFERRTVESPDLLQSIQNFAQTLSPQQGLHQRGQVQSRIRVLQEQLQAGPLPVEAILIDALCYEEELGVGAALTLMLQAAESAQDLTSIAWFVEYKTSFLNDNALKEALGMALPQFEKGSFACLEALCQSFFFASEPGQAPKVYAPELRAQVLEQLIRAADPQDPTQTGVVMAMLRQHLESNKLEQKILEQESYLLSTRDQLRRLERDLSRARSRVFEHGAIAAPQARLAAAQWTGAIPAAAWGAFLGGAGVMTGGALRHPTNTPVMSSGRSDPYGPDRFEWGNGSQSEEEAIKHRIQNAKSNIHSYQRKIEKLKAERQDAMAEAALKNDYPQKLLRLGYPLGVVLELLPQSLAINSERQAGLEHLILEAGRTGTDPNFAQSFATYFGRLLKSSTDAPKRPVALLKKLVEIHFPTTELVRRCLEDCWEHFRSQELPVLDQSLKGLHRLSLEILQDTKLGSAEAALLLDVVFRRLLHQPTAEELQQLVDLAHARGIPNEKLSQLAEQGEVPLAVQEGLRPLIGVANSMAEMLRTT